MDNEVFSSNRFADVKAKIASKAIIKMIAWSHILHRYTRR